MKVKGLGIALMRARTFPVYQLHKGDRIGMNMDRIHKKRVGNIRGGKIRLVIKAKGGKLWIWSKI